MYHLRTKLPLVLTAILFLFFNVSLPQVSQLHTSYSPSAVISAGERAGLQGRLAALRKAESETPNDPILLNNLGTTYARLNEPELAAEALERSVGINGGYYRTLLNLSVVYQTMHQLDKAIAAAQRALERDDALPEGQRHLCDLFVSAEMYDEAAACYISYSHEHEPDGISLSNLGVSLFKTGRFAQAEAAFEQAATRSNDAKARNALGLARFMQKKYEEAANAFKAAIEMDPGLDETRFNLGISLLARQNRAGALSQYNLLKESDPELARRLYKQMFRNRVVYLEGPH